MKGGERATADDDQDSIGQLIRSGHLGEKAIVSGMIAVDVVQAVNDDDRATPRSSELGTGRVELVGDLLTEPRNIVARQFPVTSRASLDGPSCRRVCRCGKLEETQPRTGVGEATRAVELARRPATSFRCRIFQ